MEGKMDLWYFFLHGRFPNVVAKRGLISFIAIFVLDYRAISGRVRNPSSINRSIEES